MKVGELDRAKRRALGLLDKWVECTGVVSFGQSYYDELTGIVEDAVEVGVQHALSDFRKLDSEK